MHILTPLLLTALALGGCTAAGPEASSSSLEPDRQQAEISGLTDSPLETVPTTPVTPRFVLEHRTALHGKTIMIRGTVMAMPASDAASGGGVTPMPGSFAQPRLLLDAGPAETGQPAHQLVVLLREGDTSAPVGQVIELEATVEASPVAVVVTRVYR